MNVKVRIPRTVIDKMRADLSLPHPFAGERVGFVFGNVGHADTPLVLMTDYMPLADDRYIDDPNSGARIDSQAIRIGMQAALDRKQGVFHVHMHHWHGRPMMSPMDTEEIPRVVTAFRRAGPASAHGIFLMHDEECAAWVWLSEEDNSTEAVSVSVVGFPLQVFKRSMP